MAKIADVVKLKTGYANFVELKSAFEESQENLDRMAMYRPTKAHRAAFERLCRGLYQPNDKKFYLLSGSYGTGKSHLCLMYANFLSRSSGDPDIKGFYDNYAKLDADTAKMLRNVRKGGQYLVAICDYHSGRRFEDVILKAVFEACAKMGLDTGVQTEFDEAERRLDEWEKQSGGKSKKAVRDFYADFGKSLDAVSPGMSVDQLRKGLKDFDSEALDKFREAFRQCMGGMEFQVQAGNLIPIIRAILRSKAFKDRFKGLAVLFDEFGYTLAKGAYSTDVLHGFMETICKTEPNVVFVGCIHKDFKAYADRLSKDDLAVMSARITTVDLLNEGIEEIIGAIVETDKDSEIWKKEIATKTGVFDQLVPVCKSLNLFPWIDDVNRIRQRVLEDIYGVHPMTLACLLRLSSEIGSDARSTFTFFSGEVGGKEGSYAEFIKDADLAVSGGKLNLYTVDGLFAFFRKELSLKNPELRDRHRQFVNGFYASLDTLRKSLKKEMFKELGDERVAVLQTILLYQLCNIPSNSENILFGLYCLTTAEEKQIEQHVKHLTKIGALFYRKQSETYELAAASGEDVYELVERYVSEPSLHPQDMVAAFREEVGAAKDDDFLEAKQYNLYFNEDKRFKVSFMQAKDLGETLWNELIAQRANNASKPNRSYEGDVVYVLCEDDAEVQVAKNAVRTIPDPTIAVAVPNSPLPFVEMLLKVKACKHYLPPNEAEKISAQTETRLRDILEDPEDGFLPTLRNTYRTIVSGDGSCWHGENGKIIVDQPKQPHKPADALCEERYDKHCRIKHPDLNYVHDDKWRNGKNRPLKEAVTVLLEGDEVLIDNGNPDNHGQKRYLAKVLLKGAGALRKTHSEGSVTYFTCESDPSKISDDFGALKEICRRMTELAPGKTLPLGTFLAEARDAPYGAGGNALVLAVAHVIRAFGERLRAYKDSTQTVEHILANYEDIVSVVADPSTKIVFEVRDITTAQTRLVDGIAEAVHADPLKHGETRTLNSAYDFVRQWWQEIPGVAKNTDIYQKKVRKRLQDLRQVLDKVSSMDRFELLLERLPSIYAGGPVGNDLQQKDSDEYCKAFAADVGVLESGLLMVRATIAEALSGVFGAAGDMIECEKTVKQWYEDLEVNQRDAYRCEDDDAKELLKVLSDTSTAFDSKVCHRLPQAYGFGRVEDWTSLCTDDYTARVKQAKAFIDEAKPDVPAPQVHSKVLELNPKDDAHISLPQGASGIIYTTDMMDPKQTSEASKVKGPLHLRKVLGDSPSVVVKMRCVDEEGNTSELTTIELISKVKKYEIKEETDLFGKGKGSFILPEDARGLVSVIGSLLSYANAKGFVDSKKAKKIRDAADELLEE